jgi:hypothetical protein
MKDGASPMIRELAVLTALMGVPVVGYASNPPGPELVATVDLSQLPAGSKDASAQSIAFATDTSIAVVLCPNGSPTGCSLSLLRREGNTLLPYASTSLFLRGRSVHVLNGGQILITPFGASPAVLFTPDLSVTQELSNVYIASQSGNTAAGFTRGGWKLYRVKSKAELIREGNGSLRSLSDEVVVFQDGNMMRVETLQGARLGSFSVKPETKCYNVAYPLGTNRLYLDDCKKIRIVDFGGREEIELHAPNGYRAYQFWSGDGKRVLFDNSRRKISPFRNAAEIFAAFATLGMGVGDEQDNREEVAVLDTSTGNSCFDWKRSFAEGSVALAQDAAISPSGEFVAIAAGGTLSVYRLPDVCR